MSLHISYNDFLKMVDKECFKKTGQPVSFYPTIWVEDFWPVHLDANLSIQDAKQAVGACIESVIETLPG